MGTMIYFNGVKGTGPLAEGSEGRQSLPFFGKTHGFLMHPKGGKAFSSGSFCAIIN